MNFTLFTIEWHGWPPTMRSYWRTLAADCAYAAGYAGLMALSYWGWNHLWPALHAPVGWIGTWAFLGYASGRRSVTSPVTPGDDHADIRHRGAGIPRPPEAHHG